MNPLVAGASAFVVTYLLGAFVAADFNITRWTGEGRFLTAIFSVVFAYVGVIAALVWRGTK